MTYFQRLLILTFAFASLTFMSGCGAGYSSSSITSSANTAVPLSTGTTGLASAIQGSPYNGTLVISGGTPQYTWTVSSGSLPAGLSLQPSTGIISGIPTTSGIANFTLTVSDSSSPVKTKSAIFSITVIPQFVVAQTAAPVGEVGTAYSMALQAAGGTPLYQWSISAGAVPAGLTLNPLTGVLSGTPATAGTFGFSVTVSDSGTPMQSQTMALSMTVTAAPPPLAINAASVAPAVDGMPYNTALDASGGTPGYKWAVSSGSLPSGLTLHPETGLITGVATTSGTAKFAVVVSDHSTPVQTKSATFAMTVTPRLTLNQIPAPSGQVGDAYSLSLFANGGTPAYQWNVTAGSMPSGLTLNPSTGIISGTPTTAGTYTFSVTVSDSGTPVQSQTAAFSVVIIAATAKLTINGATLLPAVDGLPYLGAFTASGGTPGYNWSISSGALPAGLTLGASTGIITGIATASGASTFTVSVSDHSNPVQTQSATLSMNVTSLLSILQSILPSGQVGGVYTTTLQVSGGTPGYTWSISSGSLPTGISLNASTGTLSGTPSAVGIYNATVTVTDNSVPTQTASMQLTISITAAASLGTTWYVRADGGTRYSANNPQGQCDGKSDSAYSGTGVNQHCAFGDYRFLYDDQHTYPAPSVSTWAISGGDTVIIDNTKQWRVGHDQGTSPNDVWCPGTGNSVCFNPTIPAGTASQHTRILGRNYQNCSTNGRSNHSAMTQLYGGFGVGETLNLTGTQYVDVECIEASSYTDCIIHGSPSPLPCNTNFPLSDYTQDGVEIDSNTSNVLFQDMYIHSVASYGVHGNIANPVTFNRVDVAYTGATGINLDDGTEADSPNGVLTFNYGSIEFAGCAPEYPAVHAIPVTYCFDQNSGNNGDGLGTANVSGLDMHFDHDIFAYNTEDCIDPGHVYFGSHTLTLTNNLAYGCQGASFKWGPNFVNVTFENNIAIANCARMSAPMNGTPTTYNQYLSLFCRAGDATSFNFLNKGIADVENNTFVGTESIMFDIDCSDTSCAQTSFTFRNNIVRAYADTTSQGAYNGGDGPAGLTYSGPTIGTIVEDHDLFFGPMRNMNCSSAGVVCEDPMFTNEPSTFVDETTLDNLLVSLTSGSYAKGAGLPIVDLLVDYSGAKFAAPPSMGALEYGSIAPSN